MEPRFWRSHRSALSVAVSDTVWDMACGLCAAGPAGSSRAPGAAGTDFAGVVRKVGARVQHLKPGAAVFGRQAPARLVEGHSGTLAEWCVVDARDCAHKPSNMTHEQAAAVPSAGLAAWSALALGELVEREEANRVVVIGAAGGVGTLAVQIAKRHFGARVVAVCGARHLALVKSLGADEALDHTARGLRRRCAHLRNFDLVVDCVGLDRRARPLPPRMLLPMISSFCLSRSAVAEHMHVVAGRGFRSHHGSRVPGAAHARADARARYWEIFGREVLGRSGRYVALNPLQGEGGAGDAGAGAGGDDGAGGLDGIDRALQDRMLRAKSNVPRPPPPPAKSIGSSGTPLAGVRPGSRHGGNLRNQTLCEDADGQSDS